MKLTSAISGDSPSDRTTASTPKSTGPENAHPAEAMNSIDKAGTEGGKFATAFGMLHVVERQAGLSADADTRNSTFTQDFLAEPEATDRFAECKMPSKIWSRWRDWSPLRRCPSGLLLEVPDPRTTKSRWPSFGSQHQNVGSHWESLGS